MDRHARNQIRTRAHSTRRPLIAMGAGLMLACVVATLPGPAAAHPPSRDGSAGTAGIAAPGDWKQFRFGAKHSGSNPKETTLGVDNVGDLEKAWSAPLGETIHSSAAVVGDRVYVGTLDGQLHALDRTDGSVVWSTPDDALTGDTVWTSPAVGRGLVFFGVNRPNGEAYAVDAATGDVRWTRTVGPNNVVSSPVLAGGRVTYAFTDGTVLALDPKTGATAWSTNLGAGMYSSPAVAGERLIIAVHNVGLVALNATTGGHLWTAPMSGPQWSSPAVAKGRVFVGSRDDEAVFAFALKTGKEIWRHDAADWVHTSPAVANGRVYVGDNSGDVTALRAKNGRAVWVTRLDADVFGGPSVANGVVYAATGMGDGKLVALDAANGDVLFSDFVGDGDQSGDGEWVVASPTIAGGAVYIGSYESDDSVMVAFALPD